MKMKNIELKRLRKTKIHRFSIMSLAVICFMMLFAGVSVVGATDYYVATGGDDDSNNGTSLDFPWQHPSYATLQAQAGDTIYLIDGTWYDEHVVFANSGNATYPITLTAYNGTPTLDGVDDTGYGIYLDKDYIDITGNLLIKDYARGIYADTSPKHINIKDIAITSTPGFSIHFYPSSENILIDNVNITHNEGTGGAIVFQGFSGTNYNLTVKNSYFNDNRHDAVNIHTNAENVLIENNTIYDASYGAGIMIHNYGCKNITIRNNTIEDSTRGIQLSGVEDAIVENNTILNSYSENGILLLIYSDPEDTIKNITIRNNVIKNSISHDVLIYISSGRAAAGKEISDILFVNNTIEKTFRFVGLNIHDITIRNILDATRKFIINNAVSNLQVEFTDGKVFSEDGPDTPHWYPSGGNLSISGTGTLIITTYSMTAISTTDPLDITVNKFDTSLSQGEILVDFTANTIEGNNVIFTIGSLKPAHHYSVKRNDILFTTEQADSSGYIQFSNSEWSACSFTIEESSTPPAPGTISGTVINKTSGALIEGVRVEAGAWYDNTDQNGNYTISNIPEDTYTVTASKEGYENSSEPVTVTAGNTTTVNFSLNPVGDIFPPITNATITPTPSETGWNTVTQVTVIFFRNDTGGSGVSYTNYSKTSETGPWTTVNINAAMGPDAENVTDIGEDKVNVTVSDEGVTTIWYYTVNNNATSEPIKNVTVKIDTTPPASISDLQNTTGTTWINWTWNNPPDNDFNHTMVYLNGIFKTNTPNSYYNATGLIADMSYEIGTHTVDTYGNVNSTWVNQTAKTVNNLIPRYDVNGDGTVDILDTTIVGQHFGETASPPYPRYDVNEDGTVDILDTTIVGQHFGEIMW